jgi:N-acetylneuraminic acid mutarotase
VKAINEDGDAPPSPPANATPSTVPNAPTSLIGTAGNKEIILNWTAPSDDGGAAITSYQYKKDTDAWVTIPGVLATNYTVTGLSNATSYNFIVRAVNASGPGSDSNSTGAVITNTVPNAPTSLIGTAGNKEIILNWTAPSDDGGAAISSYQYKQDAGAWITIPGALTTSYTAIGLLNATAYDFMIRAVNSIGSGTQSSSTTVTTNAVVPNEPTSLSGTPGNGEVSLTWLVPSDDGGAAISSYQYKQDAGAWLTITGALTTSYTATGLSIGTAYDFLIRAVNSIGSGTQSISITVITNTVIADMPANRGQSPAVAGYNNNLYVFGGKYRYGPTPPYSTYDTFVVYDTTTNSWSSPIPTMSVGRAWVYGTIWQDKAYIYSGTDDQTASSHQTMEIYDIPNNSFSTVATPDKRTNYAAGAINGKIYICGGYSVSIPGVANTIISYDTSTGNFETALTSMPTSLQQHAAAVYNNKLYVMGGSNAGGTTQDQLYVYDPAGSPGGTWTTLAIMPASRYSLSAVTLGSYIYAVGGSDGGLKNTVFRYNPVLDVWATVNPMLTARASFGLGVANNAMYACGGGVGLSKTGEKIL